MDRLKSLDAEFLNLEDGTAHMHIAGACVFDDPAPSRDELIGLIAGKLHLIPRYRQRVRSVPFELGRPVWVDDPHFDIGYHVRRTALPAPGGDAEFCALMGRLMSLPLDRDRPLWEAWLVEGLEGDRWALIFKVHHCMVDGIAGVQLLTVLLDAAPTTEVAEPEPWSPRSEPPGVLKVADAWVGLAGDVTAEVLRLARAVTHPTRAIESARTAVLGMGRFVGNLGATPHVSTEGTIGAHRTWAHSSAELSHVKVIRNAFGGTVNDVVLAAVSGGFRDLLLARGDDVTTSEVRSLVPVSTRGDDGRGVADNRVSAILYDIPVGVADPVERLTAVRAEMGERKGSHMVEAGEVVTTLGDLAPPMVVGAVTRTAMRVSHRLSQRAINTITTNVPGPQFPLYCLGREMLEYRPFVPISYGIRVSIAILSYNGRLYFGVTGDEDTAPDVGVVAAGASAAIDELYNRALKPKVARKRSPRAS